MQFLNKYLCIYIEPLLELLNVERLSEVLPAYIVAFICRIQSLRIVIKLNLWLILFGRLFERLFVFVDIFACDQLCDTYPRYLYVPATASTPIILSSARFRSRGRLPVLSYLHRENQVWILISLYWLVCLLFALFAVQFILFIMFFSVSGIHNSLAAFHSIN